MSMFTLYLFTKLDSIHTFFIIFTMILVFCSIIILFDFLEDEEQVRKFGIKILLPITIVSSLIAVLLPTTKEMAFIYVASKITQSERAQNIADKTIQIPEKAIEIINIKFDEYLKDIKKEVGK